MDVEKLPDLTTRPPFSKENVIPLEFRNSGRAGGVQEGKMKLALAFLLLAFPLLQDPAAGRRLEDLVSPDAAVVREAQVRLATDARPALEALEEFLRKRRGNAVLEARVADLLAVALQRSIRWEDLRAREALVGLSRPRLDRAREVARVLARREALDLGEPPLRPAGPPHEPSDVEKALGELRRLGGFAVPAALELLADARPVARAYGVLLLDRAQAVPLEREALERLREDPAPIRVLGSDWVSSSTVGQWARRVLEKTSEPGEPAAAGRMERAILCFAGLRGALDAGTDLVNGIRQGSKASRAATADEWWDEARPLWRTWWELAGEGERPRDREAWLNAVRARQGFRLDQVPHPAGGGRLEVELPEGARGEVLFDGRRVAQGPGTLTVEGAPERELRVVVTFADGRTWEHTFVSNRGRIFRLRVFEPVR